MPDPLTRYLPDSLQNHAHRAAFIALAASISLAMVSIVASQIFLGAALLTALYLCKQKSLTPWHPPPILLPLACFFIWTLVAAVVSPDPVSGLGITRKFFLFLILFLVPWICRGKGCIVWVYEAIFFVASISAVIGIFQYLADPHRDLLNRISGFMGHWMSYAGLLMLVLVALSAYVLCIGLGKNTWILPLSLLLLVSLALSLTRNAWLGAMAGLVLVLLLIRPRAVGGLILILFLLLFISPEQIQDRLRSGMDLTDANTRNRIELFHTSLRLIQDNPWFGVGPKSVKYEALRYRGSQEFPDWMYQHMHNNFLQIAAERGLPGLALWIWFMVRLIWDAWCIYRAACKDTIAGTVQPRAKEALFISTAALGCCMAMLTAGLFEYNFGDSEVLILFLFIMSAPYALYHSDPLESQRDSVR